MTDVLPILYSRLPGARDTARLVAAEGADRLAVHASSGVAAAWGFHHYLKYWCGCHVSWDHRQLSVPDPLPAVNFTLEANDAVRYYQNVCEYGYREGGRQAHQDWGKEMQQNSLVLQFV